MDAQATLLRDIDAFLAMREIAETTFGRRVVNDWNFVARLRRGGSVTLRTEERVRAFIAVESARHAARATA